MSKFGVLVSVPNLKLASNTFMHELSRRFNSIRHRDEKVHSRKFLPAVDDQLTDSVNISVPQDNRPPWTRWKTNIPSSWNFSR